MRKSLRPITTNFGFHLFGHAFTANQMTLLIFGRCAARVRRQSSADAVFTPWLPATYAEAPSATTMLLTGVMSKMGVYGFLRILPTNFSATDSRAPNAAARAAVITIVFSACAAIRTTRLEANPRVLIY